MSDIIKSLLSASKEGKAIAEVENIESARFSENEIVIVETYVVTHPTHDSIHLLWVLKLQSSTAYERIPAKVKAEIYSAHLEKVNYLNDFGLLDSESDTPLGKELVAFGQTAIQPLQRILDNTKPAHLFGSESATISKLYQYRRCDFAYRFLRRILGQRHPFSENVDERNTLISKLKSELSK